MLPDNYKSIAKPKGIEDLGEGDDTGKHFDPQNNFYYCPGEQLDLSGVVENTYAHGAEAYHEFPAKCTGNDRSILTLSRTTGMRPLS